MVDGILNYYYLHLMYFFVFEIIKLLVYNIFVLNLTIIIKGELSQE